MLLPMMGLYMLGGLSCGLALTILYIIFVVRHLRRLPWSISLGIGWLLFVVGAGLIVFAQLTLVKYDGWQYGWGESFIGVALGCWWIAVFLYGAARGWKEVYKL